MYKLIYLIIISISMISCTRNVEESFVEIQLPKVASLSGSQSKLSAKVAALESPFGLGSVTSKSSLNCYMVTVGAVQVGDGLKRNSCKSESTGTAVQFGPIISGIDLNFTDRVLVPVPMGEQRVVTLWGMQTDSGYCQALEINKDVVTNWSKPIRLARTAIDLKDPEQDVTLTLPTYDDLSSDSFHLEVDNCEIEGTTHVGASPVADPSEMFGTGADGDITISSSSFNLATEINGDGRYLSAHDRVMTIGPLGKGITLKNFFTDSHFQAGDEIMWHVSAANDGGGPDNACGGGLYLGSYGYAKIANVAGTTIVLDRPMGDGNATYNDANIAADAATSSVPDYFCRVQILRVPHFNTITLGANTKIVTEAFSFTDAGDGSGGIIAFRVKDFIDNDSYVLHIDATGLGLPADYGTGASITGLGASSNTSNNYSGGGAFPNTQGGGGGAGAAGNGGSASVGGGSGGTAHKVCSGSPCKPLEDMRMFMGSAGGGRVGMWAGSAGGGIVNLHINEIKGQSAGNYFKTNTNGDTGSIYSGGGGGGANHVTFNISSVDNYFYADGGAGQNSAGGDGGGGFVEVKYCDQASPVISHTVTGAIGSFPGENGESLIEAVPDLCF